MGIPIQYRTDGCVFKLHMLVACTKTHSLVICYLASILATYSAADSDISARIKKASFAFG